MNRLKKMAKSPKLKSSKGLATLGLRRGSLPSIPSPGTPALDSDTDTDSIQTATDATSTAGRSDSASQPATPTSTRTLVRQQSSTRRRRAASKQTDLDIEFMELVANGNVWEVRVFLRDEPTGNEFDVNRANFDGYSPLHIAVQRQDEEMVKVLLSVDDINVYDAFFYAIKEGDVGMVKQFIEYESAKLAWSTGRSRRRLSMRSRKDAKDKTLETVLRRLQDYKDKTFNSEFDDDITPLMLAAQGGHYELIKLFFDAGQRLSKIDNFDCKTEKCQSDGELKTSYNRLHIYQAISNPAYICYMAMEFNSVDPILEAFNLIQDLKKVANVEREVKSDYDDLIKGLQEFTADILGLCRDDTEVDLLLKQRRGFTGSSREKFPRLIMAVRAREIEFVTHPHVQKVLYSEWTRGFENWTKFGTFGKIGLFLWRTSILVFISLWQFIYSKCWSKGKDRCSEWSAPVSRFIHALGSYTIFLLMLWLEANLDWFGDTFDPNDRAPPRSSVFRIILGILILVFAIGHVVSTLRQFCFMPSMFFHQMWNIYEVVNHILFAVAYVFFIIAWTKAPPREFVIHGSIGEREYWPPHHPLLIGESFFSLAIILSFGRIFRMLELDSLFGPWQIALGNMLKGILRVLAVFLSVNFAFAGGMCMIYKGYAAWVDVDENGNNPTRQTQGYTSLINSMNTLYWGLYGMSGLQNLDVLTVHLKHANVTNHHDMTQVSGKMTYGVYHIISSVLLLNTIIAILTTSATDVFNDVDKQHKMARTDVWIFYGRDMKVPAPFNSIALLRNPTFLRCFGIGTGGMAWKRGFSSERCCFVDQQTPESDKKLRTAYSILVKDLLQRYFHAKATISLGEPAKLEEVTKVRETVGELRERFKVIFTDVTGHSPSRKSKV